MKDVKKKKKRNLQKRKEQDTLCTVSFVGLEHFIGEIQDDDDQSDISPVSPQSRVRTIVAFLFFLAVCKISPYI